VSFTWEAAKEQAALHPDTDDERRVTYLRRARKRREADSAIFAAQLRAVAFQAASVAWDSCARDAQLDDSARAELLDRNPYRSEDD
jgi:hypothetical protein